MDRNEFSMWYLLSAVSWQIYGRYITNSPRKSHTAFCDFAESFYASAAALAANIIGRWSAIPN